MAEGKIAPGFAISYVELLHIFWTQTFMFNTVDKPNVL